ncbi:MAG: hypothetical protein U9N87_01785, partial [Planctomycetota bacterium]|nr:hypothetical protein [Planctomycetota bacterium]
TRPTEIAKESFAMNLAIVHYHLNRGGVTRVIENQLRALDAVLDADQPSGEPWRVAILYGGRRKGWIKKLGRELRSIRLVLVEVPGLEYDSLRESTAVPAPEELAKDLRLAFERHGFAAGTTVVHVHNHALGKNRALPLAVARLAETGFPVLLQIHDFAEDFRPANYRHIVGNACDDARRLYPQAEDIHYAALNGRDHGILASAGVEPGRLSLLPNPASLLVDMPRRKDARRRLQQRFDVPAGDRFLLYPIRCIRRKNVGEALLYSALAPEGTVVGMTLAPLNPAELPIYTAWKDCSRRLDLPCRFEVGVHDGLTFAENMAAADAIITTSLAEGFGMVFLESWLAGRPLLGRDLPEITADFRRAGIEFDWLAATLKVPLDWPGEDRFRQAFVETYGRVLESYGRGKPADLDEALQSKTAGGMVDFGDLDELMQQSVIERVCVSRQNRDTLLEANPWLTTALRVDADSAADAIEQNAKTIRAGYSLTSSGQSLLALYEKVGQTHPDTAGKIKCQPLPNIDAILDSFLDPRRFRLIRS